MDNALGVASDGSRREPCSWLPAPTPVACGRRAGKPRCIPLSCQKQRSQGSTASNRMASPRTGHVQLNETGGAANCYTRLVRGSCVALSQPNQVTRRCLQAAGAILLGCGQHVVVPTASPCQRSPPGADKQCLSRDSQCSTQPWHRPDRRNEPMFQFRGEGPSRTMARLWITLQVGSCSRHPSLARKPTRSE